MPFSIRRWLLFALKISLPSALVFCLLLVLFVVMEIFVTLPITAPEALWQYRLMTPQPPPTNNYFQVVDNQPLSAGRAVFVIYAMPTSASDCFTIDYITKSPFSGVAAHSMTGGCHNRKLPFLIERTPIDWALLEQGGGQALGGFVQAGVAQVRAVRADGTQAIYPTHAVALSSTSLMPNYAGTFFFVHPAPLPLVVSLEGLDAQGQVIPDSLTYLPVPLQVLATRTVDLGAAGSIRIEAYTDPAMRSTNAPQDCVKLIFATRANLQNMLTGNTYSTETIACAASAAQLPFGARVGAEVENLSIIGGRAWLPQVTQVQLRWTDGFTQTAPVIDSFFFFQRPLTAATEASLLGFDANGVLIAQQP